MVLKFSSDIMDEFDKKLLLKIYDGFLQECNEVGMTEQQIAAYKLKRFDEDELEVIEHEQGKEPELVIWEKDLQSMESDRQKWLVDKLVPEASITIIAGKRSTFKSWGSLHFGLCVAAGVPTLKKFQTAKAPVLYIDEENGTGVLKDRVGALKKGLGIEEPVDMCFISLNNIRIDGEKWRLKLEDIIKRFGIKVIIVDSFRRVISVNEDNAQEVSSLFTDVIRPIATKHGVTWILLHHLRKGMSGKTSFDELDELRGSSEITNYADAVLLFERPRGATDQFVLKQLKCRRSPEMPPQLVKLTWGDSVELESLGSAKDELDSIDKCASNIMGWAIENKMDSFKTNEAINQMKSFGHSKSTVHKAINVLLNQGRLSKEKRGAYRIVSDTLEGFLNSENTESSEES